MTTALAVVGELRFTSDLNLVHIETWNFFFFSPQFCVYWFFFIGVCDKNLLSSTKYFAHCSICCRSVFFIFYLIITCLRARCCACDNAIKSEHHLSGFRQSRWWHLCSAIITDGSRACLCLWGCCDGWAAVLCQKILTTQECLFGSHHLSVVKAEAASFLLSHKPRLFIRSSRYNPKKKKKTSDWYVLRKSTAVNNQGFVGLFHVLKR